MLSKVKDKAVSDLFAQLADIENRHKRRLFELYESIEGAVTDVQVFEDRILPEVMEGGLSTEEFIDLNRLVLETVPGVLDMAMTIEAQALDLYLRYSNKAENEETRKVLYQIADEEMAHLRHLGNLLQKKV
jgi:rubrerythrin